MIRFLNIRYLAGDRELYDDLSWHIKPGDRVALVGDNGTGKTTLLRMAVGEHEPAGGQVIVTKGVRIGFLRQEMHVEDLGQSVLDEAMKAFAAQQAALDELEAAYTELEHADEQRQMELLDLIHTRESARLTHDAGAAESDARRVLAGLGFQTDEQDRPLGTFSGGWQMRATIARLLLEKPDLLLLDEPTNHLDIESIGWLEGFLQDFPGALVVVSHDRYFLDRMTNTTAWLNGRRIQSFSANYSGFLVQREEQEELLMRRYKNQQDEIARAQAWIDRFRAKASKATLVQSRVKALEKIERIELPPSVRRVKLRLPEPAPGGRVLFDLKEAGKAYGSNRVLAGVNLQGEWGDKIALIGRNGAGKSTLLKIIAGLLTHDGECLHSSKSRIEYFAQHKVDELDLNRTVLEEARPEGATQTDEQIRTLLGCFLFSGDDVFKPVRVLSGGEKSRLALARMMLRRGNLLLLDEPTNHLDIATREVLQHALKEFPGTVVFVSHDRYFVDSLATKVVAVGSGRAVLHLGNYRDYMARQGISMENEDLLRGRSAAPPAKTAAAHPPPRRDEGIEESLKAIALANDMREDTKREKQTSKKELTKRKQVLRQQVKDLEESVTAMEARLAEIHALLADPGSYASGAVTPELGDEIKTLEARIPAATAEWEAASAELLELTG